MRVKFAILMQFEVLAIGFTHILHIFQVHQVFLQSDQLIIIFSTVVWDYWHSVLKLHHVWIRGIVNQQNILQLSSKHPEIFDKHLVTDERTALTIESMLYNFIRVDMVNNRISISLCAGCKNEDIEMLT